MRVLNPTPGALHDRLTILELKIESYAVQRRSKQSFVEEIEDINKHLHKHWPDAVRVDTPNSISEINLAGLIADLRKTNRKIWEATDEVHTLPESEVDRLAVLAKLILHLNNARARTVSGIDEVYGAGASFEKIYKSNGVHA